MQSSCFNMTVLILQQLYCYSYYWQYCTSVDRRYTFYFTPDLPGNKLIVNDLHLLLEELMDVRSQWYDLGLYLGIQTVKRIRVQFPDSRDRLLEVLKTWLTTSDNTSWKTLTDALRSPKVRANGLAGDLEGKYCLTKEMRESKQLTLAVSKDRGGWRETVPDSVW